MNVQHCKDASTTDEYLHIANISFSLLMKMNVSFSWSVVYFNICKNICIDWYDHLPYNVLSIHLNEKSLGLHTC